MKLTPEQIADAVKSLSILVVENEQQRELVAKSYFYGLISIGVPDEQIKQISNDTVKLLESYVELGEAVKGEKP